MPGPDDTAPDLDVSALLAERDALRRRLAETEQIAEQLAEELGQARARLAEPPVLADGERLPLFDDALGDQGRAGRATDGSDPILLPIALAGTATVAFLVSLLSLANNGFGSVFSIGALLATCALGWAAWGTRVVRVHVYVANGVVQVEKGEAVLRFDLKSPATRLEVLGSPGETDWRVRFYRRGLDPCDVDSTMVDPERFLAQLREYRPEL
ncbi:hypothetical protein BH09ACT12_BH09ACT12_31320 [soil metagenome]